MDLQKRRIIAMLMEDMESYPRSIKKIAMYVVDHPDEFGMASIRDTAKAADVSTNSLVRLANMLGFESFQQLRAPFRQALTHRPTATEPDQWIEDLYQRGGPSRTKANAASSVISNVTKAIRDISPETIEAAARAILLARKVYLLGSRAPYGLAHYLYYVGRMALNNLEIAPRHANSAVDEILHASEQDVVFAISMTPFTLDTINACRWAKKKGAKLILLSDSAAESLPLQADLTIITPISTSMYFPSFVAAQAVLEWLLEEISYQGGPQIKSRIESIRQMRLDASVYWPEK